MLRLFLCALILSVVSCRKNLSEQESVKQNWESKGWTYFETFGPQIPDAHYAFYFSSESASSVEAGITIKGEEKKKEYKQDSDLYAIVSFQSSKTGDGYAMIFKKKK